ncbi:MAG TPA: amidase [Dehalococcoidia bacterium]
MSIGAAQTAMASGTASARTLVDAFLRRIAALDGAGPALNSVIELNPEALAIAEALDAERRARGPRGPLHGIPIMLKDNIDTADKMMTTAGSLALAGSFARDDAFVARRLREAGAVILGKANLSEWANFRSTRSTSGWSSRGGLTKNPYALDRNPSGSSSGSAVAVAANLCVAAVGTETDGSIISPSSRNGVVGLKPTVGLVSRCGIVPIAHSQDTAGPIARGVHDVAVLLSAMVGADEGDAATATSQGRTEADYTRFLDSDGLRGARIGVARNFFGFDWRVDRIMEASLAVMRGLGAELVDPVNLETTSSLRGPEAEVLDFEFKHDLNRYLGALGPGAPVHSLADVIAFNEANRSEVMPFFGQERLLQAEAKGPLTDDAYLVALRTSKELSRDKGIDAALAEHRLDALVAPSGGPAAVTDLVNGDNRGGGGSSSIAAVAGYPSVTLPAGYVFGLPVGISFFGGAFQEGMLLKLAFAFEYATKMRRPPQFLPSADLASLVVEAGRSG